MTIFKLSHYGTFKKNPIILMQYSALFPHITVPSELLTLCTIVRYNSKDMFLSPA